MSSESTIRSLKASETAGASGPGPRRARGARAWWSIALPPLVIAAVAIVGPWVIPFHPERVVAAPNLPPNATHWFGTDAAGMDVFARVVMASRNDVLIGLSAAIMATLVGVVIGLVIGSTESRGKGVGAVARGLARALDMFQALPSIIVALVFLAFLGRDLMTLEIVAAAIVTPGQARVVRTEVLRVRKEAYLDAARMAGETEAVLTMRHTLPNSVWPAIENISYVFGSAIIIAAGLGFLGVGLQPPTPEWGSMISAGVSDAISGRWWAALFPTLALALTVLAFSMAGARYLNRSS